MKSKKTPIGWLIGGFFWSILMGVTFISIGLGAAYPPLNYIAKPLACPTGQLSYNQEVSNPLPGTTYTTAGWTCTDSKTGAQTSLDAIKMGVYAGPFYGILLYLIVVLIWYVNFSGRFDPGPVIGKIIWQVEKWIGILLLALFIGWVAILPIVNVFVGEFLPSPAPTAAPTSIPTDVPPTPTLGSAASAPIVENIDRSKAVHAADGLLLDSLAKEQYKASDFANPGTRTYTILMPRSAAPQWEYEWCAATSKILAANLKSIQMKFVLDGKTVPLSDFAVDDSPSSNGEQCHTWYVVLDMWPTGIHQLTTTATFTSKINDGNSDYPAGDYVQDYTVTVKP